MVDSAAAELSVLCGRDSGERVRGLAVPERRDDHRARARAQRQRVVPAPLPQLDIPAGRAPGN